MHPIPKYPHHKKLALAGGLSLSNVGRSPSRRPDERPTSDFVGELKRLLSDGLPVGLAIREAARKFPRHFEADLPLVGQGK